jgi:metal-responsive CopG/Arc/MetJ family transcriptional regulator
MKTAVSIPDDVFRRADEAAAALHCSRSRLYTNALKAYLKEREGASVTERLNAVYATESSELDPVVAELQYRALTRQTEKSD